MIHCLELALGASPIAAVLALNVFGDVVVVRVGDFAEGANERTLEGAKQYRTDGLALVALTVLVRSFTQELLINLAALVKRIPNAAKLAYWTEH